MARGTSSGRVIKNTASANGSSSRRSTRQRSKMAASNTSDSNILQDMVDEATHGLSGATGLSQGMENVAFDGSRSQIDDVCPITDKDQKPFQLMSLPPEIRNEIYRACLTRPFNIGLSRREVVMVPVEEDDGMIEDGADDDEDEFRQTLRTLPPFGSSMATTPPLSAAAAAAAATTPPTSTTARNVWANSNRRRLRLRPSSSAPTASSSSNDAGRSTSRPARTRHHQASSAKNKPKTKPTEVPRRPLPQDIDPLLVNILRVSKTVYQEARSILYSENIFTLDLETALHTLACLHQRSRRQIKHVEVEIPSYNEILERFQETVRLSLRYCWGLKTLVIHMPFLLPGSDGSGTMGNSTVYANGFDILRWLPRQCEVMLRGNVAAEIEAVVSRNANLAKTLDEVRMAKHQMDPFGGLPENGGTFPFLM